MDTDRRRTSKSKRHELGYHLAIDWYRMIFMFSLFSTLHLVSCVDTLAYQNDTSIINNVINDSLKPNSSTQIDLKNANVLSTANEAKNSTLRNNFESTTPYTNIYKIAKNTHRLTNDASTPSTEQTTTFKKYQSATTKLVNTNYKSTTSYYDITTETSTRYSEATTTFYPTNEDYVTEDATTTEELSTLTEMYTEDSILAETTVKMDSYSTNKVKRLSSLSSTTLKNIVHQIQEQVNKSLNDSLYSSENVIEDSYKYVNDPAKKINNTVYVKQNAKAQKRIDAPTLSDEKVTTKVVLNEVKNKTRSTNSSKSTLEDDYNMSYEMEEYEEDVTNMKKSVTEAPSSGTFDAIRDFAGSVVESLYETYMPQGIRDLVRRMQEQNEKLETIRLRSKEENGGLGQFGRNLLKGITVPINQLMRGVRDYGSLDSDKNFFAGVASGVVSVADSVGDSFKDRVKAIFPGTLWCGDGDMARSAEVGLFFMTDSCCRRHDACKHYIISGDTKHGLTNTGLFTRSHCECDHAFYRCLKRTNSLVSSQIGLTYFSILGPQCFKREHPIMRCKRRTRITGQKCEEYHLDYNHPKVWQWFDNETF